MKFRSRKVVPGNCRSPPIFPSKVRLLLPPVSSRTETEFFPRKKAIKFRPLELKRICCKPRAKKSVEKVIFFARVRKEGFFFLFQNCISVFFLPWPHSSGGRATLKGFSRRFSSADVSSIPDHVAVVEGSRKNVE